ncbi:MAG TPA: alpha/beta hydrolase [Flavobacteriales bacterium]|nr:alpha/beta hydrolase [Flavobacteriales bacterium]
MKTKAVFLAALCAMMLSGCNLARMHGRKSDNRLKRNDYVESAIEQSGSRFAWHRDTGKPKLLLLHGYTGTGALQWSKTAKLLRKDYDCIMPDLLSHGRSMKWDTTRAGLSLDDQAAHVITILDGLGVKQPIPVVGNSYGGGVAARLAELHPERISELVIYDGLVSDYSAALADSIARAHGAPSMLAVMRTPSPKDLRFGIRLSLYRDPPLPGFILGQIHREFAEPYRAAQITLLKCLPAHEDRFIHKRFHWKMPVYLIWGERDELIPNATGRAVLARNGIPEEHWTVIPRTGHVANIERPREFVRVLKQRLEEN